MYTSEIYLIIRQKKYFACLIFVIGIGWWKNSNAEIFPDLHVWYFQLLA